MVRCPGQAISIVAFSIYAVACGTSLSTSQPAHVPEKGHLQTELGADVSFSTGSIRKVIDAAESVEDASSTRMLSDDEKLTILEGGAHLAMNPPALIPHLGIASAPFDDWEFALRLAASGFRLGVRRQLLHQADAGVDFTIGLGVGRALFTPPIDSVLETLEVTDFQRWNFDVPAALGQHGSWYRWWAGPRLLYSTLSQTMVLSLPGVPEIEGTVSGSAVYVGGFAGAAFGYRSVFIGPELTLVEMIGSANVEVDALGANVDFSVTSFIVYPAFALMGEF